MNIGILRVQEVSLHILRLLQVADSLAFIFEKPPKVAA